MTQDRPGRAELLEAVAEFLFTEVRNAVPREQRFQVLVAANVCAVVAREIRAGPEPLLLDLLLFNSLLDRDVPEVNDLNRDVRTSQAELAQRLRSGALDDRLDEVAAGLREHVRRQLAIARPGYDE
jgi:Domain of unknown function (DUF6285)